MKKLIGNVLGSGLAFLVAASAYGDTLEITLDVAADTYINQDVPWMNYGDAERLFATQGIDDETTEKIYLMFDASELPGEVVDIVDFQAVFRNRFARTGHTYLLTGPDATDWTEDGINYDNAPANDYYHYGFLDDESLHLGYLETAEQNETAGFVWNEEDTEALKQTVIAELNSGDRKIALGILRSSTNRNISYASKESEFHAPRLQLEVAPDRVVGELVLGTSDDAYINQAVPDMNFGDADRLFATEGIIDEESEKIYLKFDASDLPGDVVDIRDFQAVFLNQFARTGHAFLLTGPDATDWSEDTLTYNNAPANDYYHYGFLDNESLHLGYLDMAEHGETAGFVWSGDGRTALMEALNSGDRTVAIGIHRSSTNRNISYASKEHEEYHGPRLIMLVEGVEDAAGEGFEGWREEYFTAEELGDETVSGPLATPVGDDVPNLLKYALGLDPWKPGIHRMPVPAVQSIDEEDYLTLSFVRPNDIEDIDYRVESFGDLTNPAEEAIPVSEEDRGDGTTEYTYRDSEPVGAKERSFLWLRVEQLE